MPHLGHAELVLLVVAAGVHADIGQNTSKEIRKHGTTKPVTAWAARGSMYMLGLTFASLGAIKPPVINFSAAGTSTVLKPSAARSATTESAGFRKRAALSARHFIGRGDG